MTNSDDSLLLPTGVGPLNITVEQLDDGTLELNWDESDPAAIALGVNEWTSEQWVDLLSEGLENTGDDSELAADE
ncbi:MAG: hypothetical protein ACO3GW_02870 [Vulcanococcus sp.]